MVSGYLSVLLGNGDGTFRAGVNYPDCALSQLPSGDFNGDGKLDLVGPDYSSDNVSVLLGNGDGTFQPAVNYPTFPYPASVGVGDFNGDGKLDLAVAGGTGSVAVLLGNGDGTFQAAANYAVSINPVIVIVGDFNGDGKLDLAVSDGYSAAGVLPGNGDGTFQLPPVYTSSNVQIRSAGDFNGDGKLDLVGLDPISNAVSVLLGNGDGTFQGAANFAVGLNPSSVAVGDFNGDGQPDLAVANEWGNNTVPVNPDSGSVSVLLNTTKSAARALACIADLRRPACRHDIHRTGSDPHELRWCAAGHCQYRDRLRFCRNQYLRENFSGRQSVHYKRDVQSRRCRQSWWHIDR